MAKETDKKNRQERLEEALRANLRRRKAQIRSRRQEKPAPAPRQNPGRNGPEG